MNKKSLQAFSAGMIVSTSLLSLTFYLGGYNKPTVAEKKITETDINKYLSENEQIVISKKEYEQLIALKDQEVTKEQNQQEAVENTKETEKNNNEQTQSKEEVQQEPKKVMITIQEGMTTSDVSKALESAGIIKSASEFNQYLIKNDYHTRVQIGTFEVNENMSFYEIAEAITR
ncbi:endolytic transglycosylase MltG [Bacillus alveayuensis]|jgi:hypothetical protein|uniref:Mannitol-specific phosphotransferase system IIBC component n=1 Tax=Aeribacillus alveayuensis TaxID=279215 RepID=A0ABT9VKN5_9BACI|nr:endolytic transglycosylase MltG [Bacillus alveayuensis]MDQ0161340.1 mannitol-specific phosphotransferase system IIBC component [Bacillus alveayuensis]